MSKIPARPIPTRPAEDTRFLGKEVAYYEGLFKLWLAIMNKIAAGEDITNLVNHLESSFPYRDSKYNEEIKKAENEFRKKSTVTDRFGKPDKNEFNTAVAHFTLVKYKLLMQLLKRRKVLPQEAEVERF